MSDFTHFNKEGLPRMVDISEKKETKRRAVAKGRIRMKEATLEKILEGTIKKGDVLSVAQTAAVMSVKKTWEAIPMCHNIPVSSVDLSFDIDKESSTIVITLTASTFAATGIEMEALHGVAIAALTIYDMCKSIDRGMEITDIKLVEKTGGESGDYKILYT